MNANSVAVAAASAPATMVEKPQVGALCWRSHGAGVQILLITSRETGRWVIPKGGIIAGKDAAASARQEAWEEAGVEGHVSADAMLGCFDYDKLDRKRQQARRCRVEVFPLKVDRLVAKFPEKGERRRKWFKLSRAAIEVQEPDLRRLLLDLDLDPTPLVRPSAAPATDAPALKSARTLPTSKGSDGSGDR